MTLLKTIIHRVIHRLCGRSVVYLQPSRLSCGLTLHLPGAPPLAASQGATDPFPSPLRALTSACTVNGALPSDRLFTST
jgi:hypothetical protein